MKKFAEEFKTFITRGNVMDMAIGVIIGGAFQAIISSLVEDVIMPVLSLITGGVDFSCWSIALGSGENAPMLNYGNLINAIINFLLMALVIFLLVKGINGMHEKMKKEEPEEEKAPETKVCPYCKSEIAIDAVKCPHCTSDLPENE